MNDVTRSSSRVTHLALLIRVETASIGLVRDTFSGPRSDAAICATGVTFVAGLGRTAVTSGGITS